MFWEKCGKIIADAGGKLIDCDNCPCPYWAIFAFISRSYNKETGEINYCYQSADVKLLPVVNNCLQYSYYDMYERNIKVNRTPDENGKVGTIKNCVGCWTDCVEWDENWQNCLREQQYCDDCSQIRVYRLSPCFQTKKEAFQYFYQGTEVQPDSQGNYPEDEWSDQYYNTLENIWRKKANKYKINSSFTYQVKEWGRSFYGTFVQDCDYMVQCYDWETGQLVYEGTDYPADGGDWDCWEYQTNCTEYVISGSQGELFGLVPENIETQEQLEALVGAAINELNSYIESSIADESKYGVTQELLENHLCFNKSYASYYSYYDYSGWGNCCSGHKWYGVIKANLKLQPFNAEKHPEGAKGVIVDYTLKRKKRDSAQQEVVTEQKFNNYFIPFGGEINFPLANNLSKFYQCQCYSQFTGFEADYYKYEGYEISVTVKEYKF